MYFVRTVVISVEHLSISTRLWLDTQLEDLRADLADPVLNGGITRDGYVMFVDEDAEDIEGAPRDLIACLAFAKRHGADWMIFDDLPSHEEELLHFRQLAYEDADTATHDITLAKYGDEVVASMSFPVGLTKDDWTITFEGLLEGFPEIKADGDGPAADAVLAVVNAFELNKIKLHYPVPA